jgi:glutamate carboxypeptidase
VSGAKRYFDYLRRQQDALVREVKEYCAIESGSRDKEGVDAVGALVRKAWEALGFTTETIPVERTGDHIVARRRGRGKGRLLAHMHLDTTQPKGTLAQHPIEERNGLVYGPGIHDMKGGWVVLLGAFRAMRQAGWDGLESATIFLCGDEELGSPTAREHIERECRAADWQVIMEPAREGGRLGTCRGVVGALYLTVHGQFAHSTSGGGVSAITEAAHKVLELATLSDFERDRIVNVGLLEAGSARQAVPEKAWLSIDLRARTQEDGEDLVRRVQAIADKNVLPGARTVMSGGITRPAFPRNRGNVRMFEIAREVANEIGFDVEEAPMQRGGSDGNFGAAMGLPSLDGLGAAGGNVTGRQFIVAESLPQRAAMLAGLIERLPEML